MSRHRERRERVDPMRPEYVRSAAISLLRQNPDSAPKIPETLASIAEHDANAGIRRLARNSLDSFSGEAAR